MKILSSEIVHFFHNQNYLIISTVSKDGTLHTACKGLVDIDEEGRVYLLDLYSGSTFRNLRDNPNISITAVDEHIFKGYSLKGMARIIPAEELEPRLVKSWEDRITSRISQRVIKNITQTKGHPRHPEAHFPEPKYLIVVEVKEVVDLTPRHLKHE
jgi:hypothetical protein